MGIVQRFAKCYIALYTAPQQVDSSELHVAIITSSMSHWHLQSTLDCFDICRQTRVGELSGTTVVVDKVDPAGGSVPKLPASWQRTEHLV